jgi:hypothetical protein
MQQVWALFNTNDVIFKKLSKFQNWKKSNFLIRKLILVLGQHSHQSAPESTFISSDENKRLASIIFTEISKSSISYRTDTRESRLPNNKQQRRSTTRRICCWSSQTVFHEVEENCEVTT